jgi:hypothetical protein
MQDLETRKSGIHFGKGTAVDSESHSFLLSAVSVEA